MLIIYFTVHYFILKNSLIINIFWSGRAITSELLQNGTTHWICNRHSILILNLKQLISVALKSTSARHGTKRAKSDITEHDIRYLIPLSNNKNDYYSFSFSFSFNFINKNDRFKNINVNKKTWFTTTSTLKQSR